MPRRLAIVRQLVAARMPQHVNVDRERQISITAGLLD
jgi:hypothetical protein